MKTTYIIRTAALITTTQTALACSRFVWHEDPFTPDPAPASETLVAGNDTTYVLRGSTYYLLASQRAALWNREVLDDVAWRYRALFGEAPPVIAVRLDSVATTRDSATWRGVPLATVALRRRDEQSSQDARRVRDNERSAADDSARVRLFAGPMLSATASETWLRARAMNATRASDSQPGGPSVAPSRGAALPAWIEAGALRMLGNSGASARAAAELRADAKNIVPLASLFAVGWPARPNALEIVRSGAGRYELDDEDRRQENIMRTRVRGEDARAGSRPTRASCSPL